MIARIITVGYILLVAYLINIIPFIDIISKLSLFIVAMICIATSYRREFQNWIFPFLVDFGISKNWLLDKMTEVTDLREPLGSWRNPWTKEKQELEDIEKANLAEAILVNDLELKEWLEADLEEPIKKPKRKRKPKHKK